MFKDIEYSTDWKSVEKISKGWSTDEKYLITTKEGEKQLLRIADVSRLEEKKKEYQIIKKLSRIGINMSMPIAFGICNNGKSVYMILTWVEGVDLEEVLPNLSMDEQYKLGRMAGETLRKIHNTYVEDIDIPAETKKDKLLFKLSKYENSNVRIANDEMAVKYVYDNIDKIWKEKPVYMHGDFHPGNLIYMANGSIGVIDFNRWEVGDPYEEFYKLQSFARELSVPYCIGQIDAYFQDNIPDVFWNTLGVYVAWSSLYSIKWAEKFGQDEIDGMVNRCLKAFEDYDYFKCSIPKWYKVMKKVIVIGCPGSGKSTFSRTLSDITGIPLYHLDMLYWNADKTIVEKSVFMERLLGAMETDEWIIDGNYGSTMEMRMQACDTIFFLDYPLEVCLEGIKARKGTVRTDMPWVEDDDDEEFIDFIRDYNSSSRPMVMELLEKYSGKEIFIFESRSEAEKYLRKLSRKEFDERIVNRIHQMEKYYDEVLLALKSSPELIIKDKELRKKIEVLRVYGASGQWLEDYETDERGELPKDLKRGVLSQDGLYNLLCEIGEINNDRNLYNGKGT